MVMTRRFWTATEIEDVRDSRLRGESYESISTRLGRPVSMVLKHAKRLGVTRVYRGFAPGLRDRVAERHAAGWSDAEIAAEWGCERHCVGRIRRDLGLPLNRWSERQRRRVGEKTREQCRAAGVQSLAEIRSLAFARYAAAHGWPADLRPRAVQILEALRVRGPMTRREIADAIGMPWKGSRKSLVSNDKAGSYLAYLIRRGLVVQLGRVARGKGRGGSVNLYSLTMESGG